MASRSMTRKNANSRTDSLTVLIALVAGIVLIALAAFWVLPAFSERGSLSTEAETAEAQAAAAQADLQQLSAGDRTSADLAASAAEVDSYFRYIDAAAVSDPVNEVNLVFRELFNTAVAQAGISPANIKVGFPSTKAGVSAPAGLGAVALSVSAVGPVDTPQRLLDALQDQQILATVASVAVSQATGPLNSDDADEEDGSRSSSDTSRATGDVATSAELRFDMKLLVWYTTVPPVELNPAAAPPG